MYIKYNKIIALLFILSSFISKASFKVMYHESDTYMCGLTNYETGEGPEFCPYEKDYEEYPDANVRSGLSTLHSYPILYKDEEMRLEDVLKDENLINMRLILKADTRTLGEKTYIFLGDFIGGMKKIKGTAMVIDKPWVKYKEKRYVGKNSDIDVNNLIEKITPTSGLVESSRYYAKLDNEVDTTTTGKKNVKIAIYDRVSKRKLAGYSTTVLVLKSIEWKDNIEIYKGEDINLEDIIESYNIPSGYTIQIDKSSGISNPLKLNIKTDTNDNYTVDLDINILEEPVIDYRNLTIYKDTVDITKKATELIKNMSVDLNNTYPNRYTISLKEVSNVDTLGNVVFKYEIIDTVKNKRFTKDINISVVNEEITPNFTTGNEFLLGENIDIDKILPGIDREKYDVVIKNKESLNLNENGNKEVLINIISKETGKIFEYRVNLNYVLKEVKLDDLIFEEYENIDETKVSEILSSKLSKYEKYEIIEKKDDLIKVKLFYKNGGYEIGNVHVKRTENKAIKEYFDISSSNKYGKISELTNISSKLLNRIADIDSNEKIHNFWISQNDTFNNDYNKKALNNTFGIKLGYDYLIAKKNTIVGTYLTYNYKKNKKYNMNEFNVSAYFSYRPSDKISVASILEYSYNKAKLRLSEKEYDYNKNDFLVNAFINYNYRVKNDLNIFFVLGDSLIFNLKDNIANNINEIKVKSDFANEIYSNVEISKLFGKKIKLSFGLKAGAYYEMLDFNFNKKEEKENKLSAIVSPSISFDYKITDNIIISLKEILSYKTKKNLEYKLNVDISFKLGDRK
ncbi:autotransporter domain-containing protein [Oceanivirga miroungae]|uniref:Autotransporter domain-containing protein n=1 Tax=Oceanivirga miroungae TaxID=1130046 RepID=A0A6I8M5X9_9FUSO|nr:autotransporter domain-containing protein [Oceanivirga miroungae]VWL85349.1 hypothetical protein OMES3154_00634 [Oceanivirga miroungae]